MKIIVGITGASGVIYARQVIGLLLRSPLVREIAVVVSENGVAVMDFEREELVMSDPRLTLYDNNDMFAPIASGSSSYDAMIVVPCSVGTAGRIANGVSDSLLCRAADVMLKERRRLILALRETPYSTIHLRNLTTLSECGTIILPLCPSFYSRPQNIEQLCMTVSERIVAQAGVELPRYEWGTSQEQES